MPNARIRDNQVKHPNTILQNEHEDRADAKRSLLVNPNGDPTGTSSNPLSVNVVDYNLSDRFTKSVFNSVTGVVTAQVVTIVSFTALPGSTTILERIAASGENIAKFTVLVNDVPVEVKRTYFGSPLNIEFDFRSGGSGIELAVGDVVRVEVQHDRPNAAGFEGRIQIIQEADSV